MAVLLRKNPAWGEPGIDPRWTRSDKDGVGTAYSSLSRVWFTVSKGILNEVYYPTIDRPQIRDLQYLVTDGETFCNDERQMDNIQECLAPDALGYRITNSDPRGRYRIIKEVIGDPHQACVLMHTRLDADAEYIQLVRSAADGQVFGLIPEVADRYRSRRAAPPMEIWKSSRKVRSLPAGGTLRIQAASPFRLHWTCDDWKPTHDTDSSPVGTGHEYVDIRVSPGQRAPVRFTFFWTTASRWEQTDFHVIVLPLVGSKGPGSTAAQETTALDRQSRRGAIRPNSSTMSRRVGT